MPLLYDKPQCWHAVHSKSEDPTLELKEVSSPLFEKATADLRTNVLVVLFEKVTRRFFKPLKKRLPRGEQQLF